MPDEEDPMATIGDWIEGARPRTLPAAAAPVLVGTAAAVHMGAREPLNAVLALVVALAEVEIGRASCRERV